MRRILTSFFLPPPSPAALVSTLLGGPRRHAAQTAPAATKTAKIALPQTTPDDGMPRIHGPYITSATPGRPFLFRIPATSEWPLGYSREGPLPTGLTLDGCHRADYH